MILKLIDLNTGKEQYEKLDLRTRFFFCPRPYKHKVTFTAYFRDVGQIIQKKHKSLWNEYNQCSGIYFKKNKAF